MTVAIFVTEKQVDLLHAFIERANARAYLWSIGEYALHEAVDQLEADALRDGLNERIGIDGVQQFLADAFKQYRDGAVDPEAGTDIGKSERQISFGALWDQLNDPRSRPTPQSTIEAFRYVIRQSNPEELRVWLARRRPDERVALRKMLTPDE
jgi:hypothetical protein